MVSTKKLTAIDLFSGCGGLTQGLKKAGFRVLAAIEINSLAVSTYRMNHPRVKVLNSDIRKVSAESLRKTVKLKKGQLDLLAACPPCQGFSSLTTKNGKKRINDERNSLVTDVLKFVGALRPRAIMLENVPGLANKKIFREFLLQLRVIGYKTDYRVLDAADFGVPQRRKRLIMLALIKGQPIFASANDIQVTVEDTIKKLTHPLKSMDELHRVKGEYSERIKILIRHIPADGGSRRQAGKKFQLQCHIDSDGFRDIYGRMAWNRVSPTITGGCINPSKGRFLHPRQHRAITLREAALLQSFPLTYKFDLSRGKYAVAEMIGNALPPEFIRQHASAVRKVLRS